MTRMPSLVSLRAFEATVRLRSMSRAADELCVTHSSVSKHVQSLEAQFGVQLLRRLARSVEPTPEGAHLASRLAMGFALIEEGVAQVKPGPLVVSCSASVMMRWLIPRMADFRRLHPDIEVQILADHQLVDLMREGVSLAIRTDVVPPPPDVVLRPLMQEWSGPVCSPEYARLLDITQPADLMRGRLLVTSSRKSAWQDWFDASGWQGEVPPQGESYQHFYMALHAAACGLGLAIAPRFLVWEDLRESRLIAPFGFERGRRNVVLWLAENARQREDLRLLVGWLQRQAEASACPA